MAYASIIPMACAIPLQYFVRLREQAPDAWIIGEKILEPGEYPPPQNGPSKAPAATTSSTSVTVCLMHPDGLRELTANLS